MNVNKSGLQNLRPKVKKQVLKSKCLSCIIIEKHLVKFTFKLTFANTNVTESNYILK